jgi:mono/diheme cytochrome c family protein
MKLPGSVFLAGAVIITVLLTSCKATAPSGVEKKVVQETKEVAIGGKDWPNPVPDTKEAQKSGAEHFQHHCQICHGLDGQNTGVPFAEKMSPPVANLASKEIQEYTDGQLKWIIENGIRLTGMPAWKGILEDDEMWHMVHYIRHLPAKGSLGVPAVFKEETKEHQHSKAHAH